MHVDIVRKDGKLWLDGISCDCRLSHALPEMDIYIDRGLIERCADCVTRSGLGRKVLIVADSVTAGVAANAIESALRGAGFACRLCVLPGKDIEPTPGMVQFILSALDANTNFLLAVGSGVVTDLTRRSAFLARRPFAVFGTAASMDGYTSITSAMMIGGMKVSQYGKAARLLMFDTAILAAAPPLMQAAGVGDVVAKYNVLADWRLGRDVAGEHYCPLCAHLAETALAACTGSIEDIIACSEAGARVLIEALILAGLTVLIVGSTRPVASLEHNIAHHWEMTRMAEGGAALSHGISAGLGLVYALLFHDMLRNAGPAHTDKAAVKAGRMSKAQKRAFLKSSYPGRIGPKIIRVNKDWYLSWRRQKQRIAALISCHEQYKKDSESLPDYRDIIRIFQRMGAPASASQAGISPSLLTQTLLCAKDYRQRYSIASALDELGMLRACVEKVLAMEPVLHLPALTPDEC